MIEKNPITGDPTILAPHREERPNLYRNGIDRCPFCPGHESDTPPEISRDGTPWRIRVFPNKYPATERHEVIVETAEHRASFDQLPADQAAAAVNIYINRYYFSRDPYVCIFKNHGPAAGASIPHEHSQLIATPFVPERIVREGEALSQRCSLCAIDDQPLIAATDHFRWIAPSGASMSDEQWIVPRTHAPEMREANELGELLQQSARGMLTIADSFNWIFMNFPQAPRAHWYVQLFPRRAVVAGFEIGTASAITTTEPMEAARRLAAASRPSR